MSCCDTNPLKLASLAGCVATSLAGSASAAPTAPVEEFLLEIQSADEAVQSAACDRAPSYGAAALDPLGRLLRSPDFELARRSKRAMYRIIRHAGRPGADRETKAAEKALLGLLQDSPAAVRSDVIWMLSEIGAEASVQPLAALLSDKDVREDARCALTRLPVRIATAALQRAFRAGPEDFKHALAESLRQRGVRVEGYPSRKMVPTARTAVSELGRGHHQAPSR